MKESLQYALRVTWARPEGRIGLTILAIIVVAALLLPPMLQDPRAQPDILNGSLRPPNANHLLGTDHLSRDVLSRVVHGARVSLAVAAGAVALSVTLGALIGLIAGYAGGWVDATAMRLVVTESDFMGSPENPRPEAQAWVKGYGFESSKVGEEAIVFDATKAATTLPVPYILIQGRDDHVTPLEPARAYWGKVRSQGKAFAAIDGGHYACFTNSGQFLAAMRKYVLPLVK